MRPHVTRSAVLAASLLTFSSLLPTQAVAEPLAPGWTALPAETIACVRMPDTRGFLASLREGTALGQKVLTNERLSGLVTLFQERNTEGWETFTTSLSDVGLTPSELGGLLQEPWGAGWVLAPSETRDTPRSAVVFWADLEEEHIDTLYTVLDQNDSLNYRAARTDLQLVGHAVRQYAIPQNDPAENGAPATLANATDLSHLLITRLPGRMVAVIGTPESAPQVAQARDTGGDLNWDQLTDVETLHGIISRYLAHAATGDDDGFAPRLAADPGISGATHLSRGDQAPTFAEWFIDVPTILSFGQKTMRQQNGPEQADQFAAVSSALGLDQLGAFAGSVFSTDRGLQLRGFLGAPAPRRGLAALLDGATLPAAPPAWVPSDVGYGHLAFDLSKVWDLTLDVATQVGGPQAAQQLQFANAMAGGVVQSDIPTVLRSLGTAHRFVNLAAQAPNPQHPDQIISQPFALIWDLADAAVMQRLMAFLTQQAGAQPGVTAAEEQGFSGLRFDQQGVSGAAMLGTSNLVFGIGGDLTDRVVTGLNNPPAPADTMAQDEVFLSGQAVLPYQDGFFFQFSDGGRDLVAAARQIMTVALAPTVDPEAARQIEALMPSDDDLRAAVGASVAQMRLSDGGIILEGALATPEAE